MAKDTSVNFINKSDQPVRIKSADNRFAAFNLSPGEEFRVTDTITGSGKYDINANILINPLGRNNSDFIGNFKFDNPALTPSFVQSDRFMFSAFIYGEKGYKVYADNGDVLDWGFVSRSNFGEMKSVFATLSSEIVGYRWPGPGSPFEPGYKISTVDFGSVGDQKRWDLVILDLPPV
jgi:hypothetical protein